MALVPKEVMERLEATERRVLSLLEALGDVGDRRAVAPLIATLGDKNHVLRQQSATALGRLGDPRAFETLLKAMGDVEEEVRAKATDALGKLGDTRAVDPLIAHLETSGSLERRGTPETRALAVDALGSLGGTRAVQTLISCLDESYEPDIRRAASSTWPIRLSPSPMSRTSPPCSPWSYRFKPPPSRRSQDTSRRGSLTCRACTTTPGQTASSS